MGGGPGMGGGGMGMKKGGMGVSVFFVAPRAIASRARRTTD